MGAVTARNFLLGRPLEQPLGRTGVPVEALAKTGGREKGVAGEKGVFGV